MLTIRQKQVDALRHARWRAYAPRVAGFLEDVLGDAWRAKAEVARDDMVSRILDAAQGLGFRRLASVLKFAGLVVGSDGAFLEDGNAMAYLAEGGNPDLQLERLIASMRVAEVLAVPSLDEMGS